MTQISLKVTVEAGTGVRLHGSADRIAQVCEAVQPAGAVEGVVRRREVERRNECPIPPARGLAQRNECNRSSRRASAVKMDPHSARGRPICTVAEYFYVQE